MVNSTAAEGNGAIGHALTLRARTVSRIRSKYDGVIQSTAIVIGP